MAKNPILEEIRAHKLVIPEIKSLKDYYDSLYHFAYDFAYEDSAASMVYKRNDLSDNHFEFFTQSMYSGLVRTFTIKIDSIHQPQSEWIVKTESSLLMLDDIYECMLPAVLAAEKERFVKLNLKLFLERKMFDNQAILLMACRKNPEFNFFGYKMTYVESDFDLADHMFKCLKLSDNLRDEMKGTKNPNFNFHNYSMQKCLTLPVCAHEL